MGSRNGRYEADYPVGTLVRVRDRNYLEGFRERWHLHHPLALEQLDFAGRRTAVKSVDYYHGGYELYKLDGVPGIWHEECLEPAS